MEGGKEGEREGERECRKIRLNCLAAYQGVGTPICTVVTAKTGVKKFGTSFLLLDRLTTLQKGS